MPPSEHLVPGPSPETEAEVDAKAQAETEPSIHGEGSWEAREHGGGWTRAERRRLCVACALPAYAPHVSGSGTYARGVCERLAGRGHRAVVICGTHERDDPPSREMIGDVEVWRIVQAAGSPFERARCRLERFSRRPHRALVRPRALQFERTLLSLQPDVTLALPAPRPCVVGAARYAARTRAPALVVPFYHIEYEGFVEDPSSWISLIGSFSTVVATTRTEQEFLIAQGVEPRRIARPGMFVPVLQTPSRDQVREFRLRNGVGSRFLVATAAAGFNEPKGSLLLARAAAQLRDIEFVFIGGTPRSRAWLEQQVTIGPNVRFLGLVSEAEKAIALAAADLFALPSRADSFGIAYQEAHAMGTPSLGLDVPVMREVLGPAGFHVAPSSGLEGLVSLLVHLARRPEALARAAAEAPKVASRYLPESTCERIADLVEDVAAGGPAATTEASRTADIS